MMDFQTYKERYGMEGHPEGGVFIETHRSEELVTPKGERYQNQLRKAGSAIYFLLSKSSPFSAFHRLKSDELWHFYDGTCSLIIYIIHSDGNLEKKKLGRPLIDPDAEFQVMVPAETWFAAELEDSSPDQAFVFVGCTVTPGFEYSDFALANRELEQQYPEHQKLIHRLTHPPTRTNRQST